MHRISELLRLRTRTTNAGERHTCPVCRYSGPFTTLTPDTGVRKHALCPKCGSVERHRLQYLVLQKLSADHDFSRMRMLHFAPEEFFQPYFKRLVRDYKTADLLEPAVDYRVDITRLPFADGAFDFVFASHVLEHIADDRTAISEVRRVLAPSGIAILPVPVVSPETIEYPAPNPFESGHVRAPGLDYFNRYRRVFADVAVYTSADFPAEYQTYVYEDRSGFPNVNFPLRQAVAGERHLDVVPVCFV